MATPVSIGIDPGLSNLGIGIINADGEYVDSLVLRTDKESGVWNKGKNLYWQLEKLFGEWRKEYGENIRLAVETPSFGSNFNAQTVAFSRGIICGFAAQYSVPVVDATPASVKKVIAGHGRAAKKELREAVCAYIDMPMLSDMQFDEADAIAAALWLHMTTVNPDLKPKKKHPERRQAELEIC